MKEVNFFVKMVPKDWEKNVCELKKKKKKKKGKIVD